MESELSTNKKDANFFIDNIFTIRTAIQNQSQIVFKNILGIYLFIF
jgi:hypothetical protein